MLYKYVGVNEPVYCDECHNVMEVDHEEWAHTCGVCGVKFGITFVFTEAACVAGAIYVAVHGHCEDTHDEMRYESIVYAGTNPKKAVQALFTEQSEDKDNKLGTDYLEIWKDGERLYDLRVLEPDEYKEYFESHK